MILPVRAPPEEIFPERFAQQVDHPNKCRSGTWGRCSPYLASRAFPWRRATEQPRRRGRHGKLAHPTSLVWRFDHDRVRLDACSVVILDEAGMTDDIDLLVLVAKVEGAQAMVGWSAMTANSGRSARTEARESWWNATLPCFTPWTRTAASST
jgi:hypothetical protein